MTKKRTKSDQLIQFKIATHKNSQNLDKVCDNIRSSAGQSIFLFIKYDELSKIDKIKVEESVLDMIVTFKYTPVELERLF